MDTDIALARLASGRAVPIGAECGCGVHDGPPGFVWKQAKRSMLGPPFSLQVSFTTVKCRATPAAAERWQAILLQSLHDLGYVEGQTITFTYRYAEEKPERLPNLAAELVQLPVDVIVAGP